jgi:hypothetical protein
MANPIKIRTQVLVNEEPIDNLSLDSLFFMISEAEAEITKLEKIANKPKALTARIEKIQAGITALVEAIDAKAVADEAKAQALTGE